MSIVDGKVWLLLCTLVIGLTVAGVFVYIGALLEAAGRRRIRFRCISCTRTVVRQCATDAEAIELRTDPAPMCAPCQDATP